MKEWFLPTIIIIANKYELLIVPNNILQRNEDIYRNPSYSPGLFFEYIFSFNN